jgi:hypothetical protein
VLEQATCGGGIDEHAEALGICAEHPFAARREAIVAAPWIVRSPIGGGWRMPDIPGPDERLKGAVERAGPEFDPAAGRLLDALDEAKAVAGPIVECQEQEERRAGKGGTIRRQDILTYDTSGPQVPEYPPPAWRSVGVSGCRGSAVG